MLSFIDISIPKENDLIRVCLRQARGNPPVGPQEIGDLIAEIV
jgi:hypothetical protein